MGIRVLLQRRLGAVAAGMLCAALVAAAGAQGAEVTPVKRLRVAINGYENNFNPFATTFATLPATTDLMHLVYDGLFWSQATQPPEPWLAEKATPSRDFRVWTVTLRPNLKWQDGKPLTADDIKFSFDYYVKYTALSGRFAHHASDTPPYDRATVVDRRTVRLFFKQPAPTFEALPGGDLPMLPKHVWERIDDPGKATKMLPVGSGPFKVVKIVPDQRYVLKANPLYFKGRPLVDELDLPIVKDPNAAFQALQAGQVDAVTRNLPPELIARFAKADGLKEIKATRLESTQLYFNARKAPWSDARVRKAISMATNSQALVDRVLLGHGQPGRDGFLHPKSPWAVPSGGHEYDPAQAGRMLDAAGYKRQAGGVRAAPNGRRLVLHVLVSSFAPLDLRAVELMARQVKPIGVDVVAEPLDPATLRERRSAPPGKAPNYDAYMGGLETHAMVDPDGLYYFFHSPGTKGFGGAITGWSNREFDRLSEEATSEAPAKRKPLLYRMQRILAGQAPVIVFYYPDDVYAYRPAAYQGWVADFGEGIFNKRSFLRPYAVEQAAAAGVDGGGTSPWVVIGAILVALALLAAAVAVMRRRRATPEEEEI